MASRVYLVTSPEGNHLVEAISGSRAIAFVARKVGISAKAAKAKDLADAMKSGAKIQQYGPEDEEDDPPDDEHEQHPAASTVKSVKVAA